MGGWPEVILPFAISIRLEIQVVQPVDKENLQLGSGAVPIPCDGLFYKVFGVLIPSFPSVNIPYSSQ